MKKILFTGGGTGGHVFPALAMAEEMQRRGFAIQYVGTSQGMESKLVPKKGIPFFTVRTGAVKNQSLLKIVKTLFQLVQAVAWSWRFLGKERPDGVIGVGGYVSVPVCFAAVLRNIPLFIQEQNATAGIANRVLARWAHQVFLGFALAKDGLPANKCLVTGNPLRKEMDRPDFPAHNPNANCLLIMGGSQGAHAINEVVVELLPEIEKLSLGMRILHQTGEKDYDFVKAAYEKSYRGPFTVVPFITDMAKAYSDASMVIARSGALTVSELIAVGRPALLVPFPRKGQNDQTTNAYFLEREGAAIVVEQGENFKARFLSRFQNLLSPSTLSEMGKNYCKLRTPGALATIGDQVEKQIGK